MKALRLSLLVAGCVVAVLCMSHVGRSIGKTRLDQMLASGGGCNACDVLGGPRCTPSNPGTLHDCLPHGLGNTWYTGWVPRDDGQGSEWASFEYHRGYDCYRADGTTIQDGMACDYLANHINDNKCTGTYTPQNGCVLVADGVCADKMGGNCATQTFNRNFTGVTNGHPWTKALSISACNCANAIALSTVSGRNLCAFP